MNKIQVPKSTFPIHFHIKLKGKYNDRTAQALQLKI